VKKENEYLIENAIDITSIIIMAVVVVLFIGVLVWATWPWGLLAVFGVLSLFGAVVFVLLHRRNSE
jgi:F0F1-type ATP synthase assembly protein I